MSESYEYNIIWSNGIYPQFPKSTSLIHNAYNIKKPRDGSSGESAICDLPHYIIASDTIESRCIAVQYNTFLLAANTLLK